MFVCIYNALGHIQNAPQAEVFCVEGKGSGRGGKKRENTEEMYIFVCKIKK